MAETKYRIQASAYFVEDVYEIWIHYSDVVYSTVPAMSANNHTNSANLSPTMVPFRGEQLNSLLELVNIDILFHNDMHIIQSSKLLLVGKYTFVLTLSRLLEC